MIRRTVIWTAALLTMAGCAGTTLQSSERGEEFVEVPNPGVTMSQNASETIWVPRRYVEKGIPRGTQLVKDGYQALQSPSRTAEPRAPEPRAPEPQAGSTAPAPAAQAALVRPGGVPANLVPHFGLIVAVDQERVYFNLGQDAGLKPGQRLKVYRGGTVVDGLGLAPGQEVATIEVAGFVGTNGGYGVLRQGKVQKNDLVGAN